MSLPRLLLLCLSLLAAFAAVVHDGPYSGMILGLGIGFTIESLTTFARNSMRIIRDEEMQDILYNQHLEVRGFEYEIMDTSEHCFIAAIDILTKDDTRTVAYDDRQVFENDLQAIRARYSPFIPVKKIIR